MNGFFAASLVCAGTLLPSIALAASGDINPQDAVIADANAACMAIIDKGPAAVATLEAAGWEADSPEEQPTYDIMTGTQDYADIGTLEYYAVIEHYPGYTINFCSTSVYKTEFTFDIARIGENPALTGTVESYAGRDYGSWQMAGTGHPTLVLAHQLGGDFTYQVSQITNLAGSPAEMNELAGQMGKSVVVARVPEATPDDRIAALSAQMADLKAQIVRLTELLTQIRK